MDGSNERDKGAVLCKGRLSGTLTERKMKKHYSYKNAATGTLYWKKAWMPLGRVKLSRASWTRYKTDSLQQNNKLANP